MTPTTVRMVLVEGDKADGVTVDHDVFDVTAGDGAATSSAAEQVVAAVLGTQESAEAGGHHLTSIGVTWTDHTDAAALRDALAAHGIEDVMLVSEGHAAGALAQAIGRAVGYDTTALLFIDRDAATLSVVRTDDGSVVKVLSRSLHSSDAMAVLTEMAAAVDAQDAAPQGMFVVGSGVDVSSVKAHLEHLVSLPVNAPDEPELALARGAALASANAPAFEASTVGLAYSQDPDGTTAGGAYGLAGLPTEMAPAGDEPIDDLDFDEPLVEAGRKPFLLVGSALTSIFVIGVVALVISLAVSIRPTADQRPAPGQSAVLPSAPARPAAPAPVPQAEPAQAPPPAPPPETIKAPVPVVQEAPAPQAPRTVYVEQPQAPAPAPPPEAPAPAPEAPPPAPEPVAPVIPAPVPIIAPPFIPLFPQPRVPVFRPPWQPETPPWQPPSQPRPQEPQWPFPGSGGSGNGPGGWNPGSGSGDWGPGSDSGPGGWNPGSGGGSGGWNPGGSGSGGSGNWDPGSSSGGGRGGSGGHGDSGGRGGSNGGGGNGGSPFWPFPSGGGRH